MTRGGRRIELRPKEYVLFEFLMRNSHRPVTKSRIIEHMWDIHFDSISNVVQGHHNSLRGDGEIEPYRVGRRAHSERVFTTCGHPVA